MKKYISIEMDEYKMQSVLCGSRVRGSLGLSDDGKSIVFRAYKDRGGVSNTTVYKTRHGAVTVGPDKLRVAACVERRTQNIRESASTMMNVMFEIETRLKTL